MKLDSSAQRLLITAGADRVGVALDAKAGEEVNALDMNALVTHQARGEHRIQATGDQGYGFAGFGHDGGTGVVEG